MKWGVAILVSLGLLAAVSAAVLVNTLRGSTARRNLSAEVDVVLAAKSLPAISVVTSSHVTKEKILESNLPQGYLSNPVQAIGRVLAIPVVEGQVLTQSCFVADGTGALVAASLPAGMRAVNITLSSSEVTGGLLYPGCVVDVLASFELSGSKRGEAISTTLLRSIQVLAVEGASIVSSKEDSSDNLQKQTRRSSGGHLTVTLMVDPRQAEALQLAMSHGSISVAMRNPLDKSPVDTEATVLNQGRLAIGDSVGFSSHNAIERLTGQTGDSDDLTMLVTRPQSSSQGSYYGTSSAGRLSWPVTVIRGREVQQKDLAMP